jgi:alginate O-acetyltransferase complex protein AlgI
VLFNSFAYLVFLPIVVTLFWVSPRFLRTLLLLVASYVFYMSWKPEYGLLILGLTAMNYWFGLRIADAVAAENASPTSDANAAPAYRRKKFLLVSAVTANLVLLGVFKYAYFMRDLAADLAKPFGGTVGALPWHIILPLGISFFVFEFIHYVVDVYKGGKPIKSFVELALFASFFPTQIAGPIKRYQDFIPQLVNDHKFKLSFLDEGLGLIIFGLFKKVVFADNLAVVVQSAFSRPDLLTGVDLWFAVYAFAFQIYFDFSGYTDIARGSAKLLGYNVPINFNLPYLAGSITEFWHRWHISLSTWLRDYLFIPLGGSRGGQWFTYRNLMITMLLGGLWHGAALHYVIWGAYQGVFLVLHKEYKSLTERLPGFASVRANIVYRYMSIIATFHLVCIGWVFFRAETFNGAMDIIRKLLFIDVLSGVPALAMTIVNAGDPIIFMLLPAIIFTLACGQVLGGWLAARKEPLLVPIGVRAMYFAALVMLLLVFSPDTSPKFIYFQF